MRRPLAITMLCLATLLLPGLPVQAADPPPALPAREYQLPEVTQTTLPNGIRVFVVPRFGTPVVRASLILRGGDSADPPGREGLATLTAALLTAGTNQRTALELDTAADEIGAVLAATSERDWLAVTVDSLSEYATTAVALLGEIVQQPTFPEDELEKSRQQFIVAERADATDPETIAGRALLSILYGQHPYGRAPSVESLQAITREDVVRFWQQQATPRGALLVIVGDLEADEAIRLATASLGNWRNPQPSPQRQLAAPPRPRERTIYLVDRPGSTQAELLAGHLLAATTRQQRIELQVLNSVLSRRLNDNLREEKGYTYGAVSGFGFPLDRGYFVATAAVRNEVAGEALGELLSEIERIRRDRVPSATLDAAKSYLLGSFARALETNADVAREITGLALRDRPLADLTTYLGLVERVDAAAVQRAAQQFLQPDELAIVVVGDAAVLRDQLMPIARVVPIDPTGRPLRTDPATDGGAGDAGGLEY